MSGIYVRAHVSLMLRLINYPQINFVLTSEFLSTRKHRDAAITGASETDYLSCTPKLVQILFEGKERVICARNRPLDFKALASIS